MTSVSTHVLDTARGCPAAGVSVTLEVRDGDGWRRVASAVTGVDGRCGGLPELPEAPATCRLVFATARYLGEGAFFPEVAISFSAGEGEHYHVPLLLSPYGYTIYRGS
ncbi:MAG: hydroxyisourate hydrolase [Streptosporangiaceae bacterium]